MRLLAIDTSSDFMGLAVIEEGIIKASLINKLDRAHCSVLIPRIEEVLDICGFSLEALDGFVLDVGPGSFTGLRIGVATVKGFLCASNNKNIKLIKSLEVIASNIGHSTLDVCTILDAKKNNFYFCLFRLVNGIPKQISQYQLLKAEELIKKIRVPTVFLGDGIFPIKDLLKRKLGRLAEFAQEELWYPRPDKLALLGYRKIKEEGFDKEKNLLPFYIYPKECTITIPNKKVNLE